jgi:hypothetical protein
MKSRIVSGMKHFFLTPTRIKAEDASPVFAEAPTALPLVFEKNCSRPRKIQSRPFQSPKT